MPRAWSDRLIRRGIDRVLHRRRFDAFHLSAKRVGEFFNSLKRFRPTFVYGYPTLIRAFAELCIQQGLNGRDLHVNVLISTGELLPPDTRKVIGEFFDCRVVNEYGCTESGILSMECEFGTPHVVPVAAFPEVVDADGHPKDMGEMGEVVVTDLYGEVMPLLRYRLHDAGSLTASHCPCGRDLPRLEPSSGRIDSFIQTPRRGPVYDAILAYSIPPGVQRFRAFQVAVDHLTVQVVPGVGFQDETAALCRERLERALGPDLTVSVQVVHDIPTEASGKLRYFVPLSE